MTRMHFCMNQRQKRKKTKMNEINVGDTVLLQMGADYASAPKGLKRWDGCQFVVSKMKTLGAGVYYELKSCKSTEGISYSILPEWITKTR